MGIGTGVELEWSIVYHSLAEGGVSTADLKKRNQRAQGKLQPYGRDIAKQAKDAVEKVHKVLGPDALKNAYHTDEWTPAVRGNPEPKTDVIFKKTGRIYKASVKMRGGIQLQSGEGKSTANMFRLVAQDVYGDRISKNLIKIIEDLTELPTRMGSMSNIERLKTDPKLTKEFITGGDIKKNLLYEGWVENRKPELMSSLLGFMEEDPQFKFALVKETMTGALAFGQNKMAIAEYILTPDYFKKIDDAYVRSKMNDVKMDVRAKSRGGVTSIAMRIELRK